MRFVPHHAAISVRDLDASTSFYGLLGFREVHRYVEEDGSMTIVHMKLEDTFLEIFWFAANSDAVKVDYEYANNLEQIGVKHIALATDDIEGALRELREKSIATGETKITHGRTSVEYFFVQDPDGVWVEIVNDQRYR